MHTCHYYQLLLPSYERQSKVYHVHFSGGHFNPAVSLSIYLCGGMELLLLVPYVLAQMFGGMIGAGLAKVRKNLWKLISARKIKKVDEK